MTTQTALAPEAVSINSSGGFRASYFSHAREAIMKATAHTNDPVSAVHVHLIRHRDPSLAMPFVARVNLQVGGRVLRAHAAAASPDRAIDLLEQRLRGQIARLRRGHRRPSDAEFEARVRPGRLSTRTDQAPRIVKHVAFEPPTTTIDEAIDAMDTMDFDFYLFQESQTGKDTVLYRGGPTGYRLAQVRPSPNWQPASTVPVTVSPHPAARHTLPDAIDHLEATGQPFLFYAVASGRARLIYHRYDGNYGLIMPPEMS
jgi:ribosome-associated translation inhibitor RaiA